MEWRSCHLNFVSQHNIHPFPEGQLSKKQMTDTYTTSTKKSTLLLLCKLRWLELKLQACNLSLRLFYQNVRGFLSSLVVLDLKTKKKKKNEI